MLTCICGEEFGYNMGNLKTYTLTLIGYLDHLNGVKIYANYNLNFPYTLLKSFSQLNKIMKSTKNVTILIDEMHVLIDQYSTIKKKNDSNNKEWLFKEIGRQTRKRNMNIYYVNQTFADTHKSIRRITNRVWITSKHHYDLSECHIDECYQSHLLRIYDVNMNNIKYFKVNPEIFKLYDTNQIIEWEL